MRIHLRAYFSRLHLADYVLLRQIRPMEFKFLGTGGAFDVPYGNSAMFISLNGYNILLDCGHSVFPRLVHTGLVRSIDGILITHFHDDHVGSLASFILYHGIVLQKGRMKIYCPENDFADILRKFLSLLTGDPEKYAEFLPIPEDSGIGFIETDGMHVDYMPTYAYYFRENDRCIVYSGDLGDCDFLFGEIEKRELKPDLVFHEIFFLPGVDAHTYYKDLIPWSEKYEIYGYHCDPAYFPEDNPIPYVCHQGEWLAGTFN